MRLRDRFEAIGKAFARVRGSIETIAKSPAEWESDDSFIVECAREEGVVVYRAGATGLAGE
ncbi:MAG: hypothetical protein HYV26_24325 [Candidatus Hydrogenedentes bacterium]|nr:hypothetical protein [Candidatus Hydrogenedentota bacterium]